MQAAAAAERAQREAIVNAQSKADEAIAAALAECKKSEQAAEQRAARADANAANARAESWADETIAAAAAKVEECEREVAAAANALEKNTGETTGEAATPPEAEKKGGGEPQQQLTQQREQADREVEAAYADVPRVRNAAKELFHAKVRKARAEAEHTVALAAKETRAKVAAMRHAMAEAQAEMLVLEEDESRGGGPGTGRFTRASNMTLATL